VCLFIACGCTREAAAAPEARDVSAAEAPPEMNQAEPFIHIIGRKNNIYYSVSCYNFIMVHIICITITTGATMGAREGEGEFGTPIKNVFFVPPHLGIQTESLKKDDKSLVTEIVKLTILTRKSSAGENKVR